MAEVAESSSPLLELRGISKAFGGVRALRGVDFSLRPGTVHALIGENGAGKSTLMKVLSGAYQPDSGKIVLEGQHVRMESPHAARSRGIAMIYQELNLAPDLSVEQNIVLGVEESRFGFARPAADKVHRVLDELGHGEMPLDEPVGRLSIAHQQVVEIARALISDARIVVMDEPTSSLTHSDTRALFQVIPRLTEAGIAVVYISHFLEEVLEICDDYTVLRDGQTVGSGRVADTDIPQIVTRMVGRTVDELFPSVEHDIGEPVLSISGAAGDPLPADVSFQVRAGEVLGVAGLVGSGRSETLRAIFGLDKARAGDLKLQGKHQLTAPLRAMGPRTALRHHIDLLSENRKEEGLAVELSIADNLTLSTLSEHAAPRWSGFVRPQRLTNAAERWMERLAIRCRDAHQSVSALSGGNQQKVALARLLECNAEVLLLDEPTRGVDVGSKVEIYQLILELAKAGKAVVFVSSYLPELFGVCDTLAVMHRGRLSAARPVAEWTPEQVMLQATSGSDDAEKSLAADARQ